MGTLLMPRELPSTRRTARSVLICGKSSLEPSSIISSSQMTLQLLRRLGRTSGLSQRRLRRKRKKADEEAKKDEDDEDADDLDADEEDDIPEDDDEEADEPEHDELWNALNFAVLLCVWVEWDERSL